MSGFAPRHEGSNSMCMCTPWPSTIRAHLWWWLAASSHGGTPASAEFAEGTWDGSMRADSTQPLLPGEAGEPTSLAQCLWQLHPCQPRLGWALWHYTFLPAWSNWKQKIPNSSLCQGRDAPCEALPFWVSQSCLKSILALASASFCWVSTCTMIQCCKFLQEQRKTNETRAPPQKLTQASVQPLSCHCLNVKWSCQQITFFLFNLL